MGAGRSHSTSQLMPALSSPFSHPSAPIAVSVRVETPSLASPNPTTPRSGPTVAGVTLILAGEHVYMLSGSHGTEVASRPPLPLSSVLRWRHLRLQTEVRSSYTYPSAHLPLCTYLC